MAADDLDAALGEADAAAREGARDQAFDRQPALHRAAHAGEDQQVADDLRRPVRLVQDAPELGFLARVGRRSQQQLDVAEHALQRVVDLVRDAGHELAERGELLGLREPGLQGLALGLEAARFGHVARDDDATHRRAVAARPAGSR